MGYIWGVHTSNERPKEKAKKIERFETFSMFSVETKKAQSRVYLKAGRLLIQDISKQQDVNDPSTFALICSKHDTIRPCIKLKYRNLGNFHNFQLPSLPLS